jgi:hypothetical protein
MQERNFVTCKISRLCADSNLEDNSIDREASKFNLRGRPARRILPQYEAHLNSNVML